MVIRFPKWLCIFILCFVFQSIDGQKERQDFLGSWVVFAGTNQINEKWSIPTVGILRHKDIFRNFEFVFGRTGLSYHFKNKDRITAGFGYLNAEFYKGLGDTSANEQFWIYEEFATSSKWFKQSFSHRIRIEHRFINRRITEDEVNHRIRYRLQYSKKVYKDFYVKTFNEFFLKFDAPHFNQNRFFLGMGYAFSENLKFEVGYLKNHFSKSHFDRLRIATIFKTKL